MFPTINHKMKWFLQHQISSYKSVFVANILATQQILEDKELLSTLQHGKCWKIAGMFPQLLI